MVDTLAQWRATRGLTKKEIRLRGKQKLPKLQEQCVSLLDDQDNEPQLSCFDWEHVKDLFDTAWDIKGVNSPVFASKLCHFLFPNLFPVADRALINIHKSTYREYWTICKFGWSQCTTRQSLQDELRQNIQSMPIPSYPWSTKITELCYISQVANKSNSLDLS